MRVVPFILLATLVGSLIFIDWAVINNLSTVAQVYFDQPIVNLSKIIYWSISVGIPFLLIISLIKNGRQKRTTSQLGSIFISLLCAKIIFLISIFIGDIIEVIWSFLSNPVKSESSNWVAIKIYIATGLSFIVLAAFIYGITKGKYNYTLHRHTIYFKDLPEAFDGFTITQVSDIHSGSFHNKKAVAKGVELIKKQHSDLFVFTGDLVNNKATEIEPWIDLFKEIKAPYGQFSILGNHDYGDYISWPSTEAKTKNMERLMHNHAALGFRLLLDEHVIIEKEGQKIALLGVENWGVGFGKRGNLAKALYALPENIFKVLLSHDPSHWEHEVKQHYQNIHLTFSGHTHGMQLGIEMFGWKWSPSKFRYPKWAGLYREKDRYLYVNRGFGFLGFAGRVGIWPEVAVITLKREK